MGSNVAEAGVWTWTCDWCGALGEGLAPPDGWIELELRDVKTSRLLAAIVDSRGCAAKIARRAFLDTGRRLS